ncbi:MAG: linear amide C-N hydrolase [Candidatus Aureabacteria bacterium]|nr:linear amide C-N hydrolase [Candidatus Auribacterota bacterium]
MKGYRCLFYVVVVASILFIGQCAWSCSELFLNNEFRISARTMEFLIPMFPQMVLSPCGVERTALLPSEGDTPITWTAKYGSVSIYAFGQNICTDGINEHGLSAAILWCEDSKYPTQQSDRAMSINYWAQYFLDMHLNVADAVVDARDLKLYNPLQALISANLHLVLHDSSGDSAVLEYDGLGNLNVYRPDSTPTAYNGVMTNEPFYPLQIANLMNYKPWGGALDLPGDYESESRFVRGSYCLKEMYSSVSHQAAVGAAFQFIEYLAWPYMSSIDPPPWFTLWTAVRDHADLTYYFTTMLKPGVRSAYLNYLDFTAGQSMKMQGLDDSNEGDVGGGFLAMDYHPNGLNSYKPLSINPYKLFPQFPFSYTLYLGQNITKAFDLYVVATGAGQTWTIYLDGKVEEGIKPVLKNQPGARAPILLSVTPGAVFPIEARGQQVTFYVVAVEAGKIPPALSLEGLAENTPNVIYMDKEQMTIK